MTRDLNLADIQGNVVRAYAAYGFAKARYFFLHIDNARVGRAFVDKVRRKVIPICAEADSRGIPIFSVL